MPNDIATGAMACATDQARREVLDMINAAWMCQAIGAACELGVTDRLAAGGTDTVSLACELQLAPDGIARLIRALAALGLVREERDGVSLTARGRYLAADIEGSLQHWARLAASRGWSTWTHLRAGIRSGRSIRDAAAIPAFAELEAEEAARFNRAMMDLTLPVASELAQRIHFIGTETLVDVGGGAGHLLVPILSRYPGMRGIVFDLPHSAALAQHTLDEAGIGERCRHQSGSFFDSVPSGADVYVMKSVLHNWDDPHAGAILQRCREAMAPGSRLLVVERVLAEATGDNAIDRENVRSDLQMLLACDGRERTAREFAQLLRESGLRMGSVVVLTPQFSAIEASA